MTYTGWFRRHRVSTVAIGKLDVFVVTLVDGRRAAIQPITAYDAVLARAYAFVEEHPCQIKVLPMTGDELWNMLGWAKRSSLPTNEADEVADRKLTVDTLLQVARDGTDPDARRAALDLLTTMGVLRP